MNLRDTNPTSPTLILNASPDAGLLNSRAKLLNEAGYYTTAAHSPEETLQIAASMNCNIALICYSFAGKERMAISERLRRLSPCTTIVWLQPGLDDNHVIFVSRVKNALATSVA